MFHLANRKDSRKNRIACQDVGYRILRVVEGMRSAFIDRLSISSPLKGASFAMKTNSGMAFPWLGSPEACMSYFAPNLKIRNFRAPLAARNPTYRISLLIDRQIHPFVNVRI
jgi:hypothetical protein